MTIKLREKEPEDCLWAINMLSNLARYTYTQNQFFLPNQYIAGNGTSLHAGTVSHHGTDNHHGHRGDVSGFCLWKDGVHPAGRYYGTGI